jgi:colicin import membrane protein
VVQVTLYQLQSQSQATTRTNQKIAGEAQKTSAPVHQTEQMESRKQEQQKQEAAAAARKKAEDAKKAEQQKKAEEARKKAEQAAIAKKKAEEEQKKKQAEEARKKAEAEKKRKAEEARKKAEADKQRKAQEAARKAQEDRKAQALAELLSTDTQYQQTQADTLGSQVAGSFDDLIRQLVSQNWTRPPSARNGMVVVVQINMLPDGTIANASVSRSSGDAGFDSSAVNAVRNVGRISEMQGLSPADFAPYRSFKMTFTPEDLAL